VPEQSGGVLDSCTQRLSELVVLLADDEPQVRMMTARTLEFAGYSVVEARDGMDAWQQFHRQPGRFGALVTDVVMPRITGTELAARVHAVRPELPVVLMTGYTPAELLARGLEASHGTLVTKPFNPATLIDAMRAALGAG
jgi:CheY-like chemotaxis protein